MIELADLPTRRAEAWKYSDLRRAMDENVQFAIARDRNHPAVQSAAATGGVIGALAAQMGGVEALDVASGDTAIRIDRPKYSNLEPDSCK